MKALSYSPEVWRIKLQKSVFSLASDLTNVIASVMAGLDWDTGIYQSRQIHWVKLSPPRADSLLPEEVMS